MRRIGVITSVAADDPETDARMAAFHQGLQEAGWIIGSNVQIEYRWGGAGDAERIRKYSAELVGLSPDVILAVGVSTVGPLQRATRTIPIIFVQVTDPVGAGFVASLARPGGNATGFATYEFGISVKWLELLKEIALSATRVSVPRDPTLATGIGLLAAMQGVAPALRVDLTPVGVGDAGEIERAVVAFAREPNGGLVVPPVQSPIAVDTSNRYRPASFASRTACAAYLTPQRRHAHSFASSLRRQHVYCFSQLAGTPTRTGSTVHQFSVLQAAHCSSQLLLPRRHQ